MEEEEEEEEKEGRKKLIMDLRVSVFVPFLIATCSTCSTCCFKRKGSIEFVPWILGSEPRGPIQP